MPSGNYLVDMDERIIREGKDENYCSDCKKTPCRCDEKTDEEIYRM